MKRRATSLNEKLVRLLGKIRSDNSEDMETAVRMAFYASSQDDVVLYSPGTPHEEGANTVAKRGNEFKMSVAQL